MPSAQIPSAPPTVELVGIDKRFGAVHANRAVSLSIASGSVHGIIGENGAGKSTLMSILYGYYRADAGEIRIAGKPVEIKDSHAALAQGIGMVHQHFMLVDPFTVLENITLGVEGGFMLAPGAARARAALQRLQRDYKLDVDLDAQVGDLPVGSQQRVEILKALYRGAQVLILDEPTGVLTPQEADHLFRILRALRDEGKTVILITHKLREVLDVTDRVTVMRQGAVVAERRTSETSKEELAELMVGRKVLLRVDKKPAKPGDVVLAVDGLTVTDANGVVRVKQASFTVRSGEIVGVAGVSGNGQSELLAALSGIRRPSAGTIRLGGREISADHAIDPAAMRRIGLAHVPEDRQRMGLVTAFAISESAILGYQDDRRYNGPILMDRGKIVDLCGRQMGDYDVRPSDPRLRTAALSGGNQQKVVLAREFDRDPNLLLVGQPTRGVDIGAIEFIHRRLIAMRDAGKAVLLISVELDEILALSDRILVMFDGRIVGEVNPEEATERRLGLMMAGIAERAA
jgi:simple sugar transport system ATP-binding protein